MKELVYNAFTKLREEFSMDRVELNADTVVYGDNGFTSIQLVRLIVELEDAIYNKTEKEVDLSDDAALSVKNSPFATLGSLQAFIEQKIAEA
ncbi:MAG: hypothetical protein KDC92_11735 [Bacteroidetes bacterium]|nr:hypothetical protein [Bacteroidota bacterium]